MSRDIHNNHQHDTSAHGSISSYVIGFVLSLIFSIIPYYLVVNKSLTGNALTATILTFGVIQMLIQIIFFLHLGRGPKPLYNVVFFGATAFMILVVVIGSIFIMKHLHYNMSPEEVTKKLAQKEGLDQVGGVKTGACQDKGETHKVTISGVYVDRPHISAKLCDTLQFVNENDKEIVITFGTHPNHGSYGGENAYVVSKSRPAFVTLNQLGEHLYHDHLEPTISGSFSVVE